MIGIASRRVVRYAPADHLRTELVSAAPANALAARDGREAALGASTAGGSARATVRSRRHRYLVLWVVAVDLLVIAVVLTRAQAFADGVLAAGRHATGTFAWQVPAPCLPGGEVMFANGAVHGFGLVVALPSLVWLPLTWPRPWSSGLACGACCPSYASRRRLPGNPESRGRDYRSA